MENVAGQRALLSNNVLHTNLLSNAHEKSFLNARAFFKL